MSDLRNAIATAWVLFSAPNLIEALHAMFFTLFRELLIASAMSA